MPPHESIVARRQRYLERQMQLRQAAADSDRAGRVPQGTGPPNRHGMPKLPVGQRAVTNWPVLDLGDQPDIPIDRWTLEITGSVEHPVTLAWRDFMALPQVEDVSDFHCVTTWSRFDNEWTGVRVRTLVELIVPRDSARFLVCTGHDRDPASGVPYTTSLPLARVIEDDVLLVHTWHGQPLPREHGGPCRMITPRLYAWKGTKWIRTIEVTDEDRRGFWERRGYSNSAQPWHNDRFSS